MARRRQTEHSSKPIMHRSYDFRGGVRGKYADRFGGGRNVVVLEPDVAAVFTDSAAVNQALRRLIKERQQDQALDRSS